MNAYETNFIVTDSREVILSNVPFRPGQRVKVVVTAEDEKRSKAIRELKALFKTTQALPQVREISEDEIVAEIEAYRQGK